jgi:guanylate kinase
MDMLQIVLASGKHLCNESWTNGVLRIIMAKGILFVIAAPSGAGKTTLIRRIREQFPDLVYSISCTTRAPRKGEIDGVHYYFLSRDKFEEMVEQDKFFEWKEVHGNLYGTPVDPVQHALAQGKRMVLDIDVEGAKEVFRKVPEAVGIFVNAPDMATLEKRLRSRDTESEEVIATRLRNAQQEIVSAGIFQYQIINDKLNKAVEDLANIIRMASDNRAQIT